MATTGKGLPRSTEELRERVEQLEGATVDAPTQAEFDALEARVQALEDAAGA